MLENSSNLTLGSVTKATSRSGPSASVASFDALRPTDGERDRETTGEAAESVGALEVALAAPRQISEVTLT